MSRQTAIAAAVFLFLIALGVGERIYSNELRTYNFTPLASTALFAGFFFSQGAVAVAVPLAIMTISNVWLFGQEPWFGYERWEMMVAVYAALLMPLAFRWLLRNGLTVPRVAIGAVGSALLFFAVTNFAHWYFVETDKTLLRVYADGLPFLWRTLAGDLVFSALLFGGYALAVRAGNLAEVPAPARAQKPA